LLFLGHNFPTTNVERPIKLSKDADFRLVWSEDEETFFDALDPYAIQLALMALNVKNSIFSIGGSFPGGSCPGGCGPRTLYSAV